MANGQGELEVTLTAPAELVDYKIVAGDGIAVLVHKERPTWLAVNSTGALVAGLLLEGQSQERIAQTLVTTRGIDSTQASTDVAEFVGGLEAGGFVGGQPRHSTAARRLRRLHINITSRCNLRCRHCAAATDTPVDLSGRVIERLIDEAASLGDVAVAFSGGEPLIRDDALDLIRDASALVETVLTTNAHLLTREMATALARANVECQVSLDGAEERVHDSLRGARSHAHVMAALHRLAAAGARTTICTTVTRQNAESSDGLIETAGQLGVEKIRFSPLQRLGRASKGWRRLSPSAQQYEDFYRRQYLSQVDRPLRVFPGLPGLVLSFPDDGRWCRLGETLAVDADGAIYPCALLMDDRFRLGHVSTTTLAEALTSDRLGQVIESTKQRWRDIPQCRECVWRAFCQAGCPASVLWEGGSFDGADGFCELRDELYRKLLLRLARDGANGPVDE